MTWGKIAALTVVAAAAGCSATHTAPPAARATPTATPDPVATATAPAPLTVTTSVTSRHPRDGDRVGITVSTTPGAQVTAVAHFEASNRRKAAQTDITGLHTFWFPVGSTTPGYRVTVVIRVTADGQKSISQASFTPRQPAPPPAPKPPTPPPPAPPPAPTGCYPRASSGNCYEPGEFCPEADAGMSGIAGDGETIICENNNGLRWEPA